VNEGFVRMTGYTKEEAVGRSSISPGLGIWVKAEDRRRFVHRLETERELSDFDTVLRRKDGSEFMVLASARTIEIGGEACLIAVVKDITVCGSV
jgi:PAS domain S-box-containing protein